jgi:hypothetical protein
VTKAGARPAYTVGSGGERISLAFGVRTVLLHHLVVNTKKEEGRDPLTDEQRFGVLSRSLEGDRAEDRNQGCPQEDAAWDFSGCGFEHSSELVFLGFPCCYTVVSHEFS